MAGWLVTHKPADVSRAMLLYPPADFDDFVKRHRGISGLSFPRLPYLPVTSTTTVYNPNEAISIIKNSFNVDVNTIAITDPVVTENSFGVTVRRNSPANYPPVFILHGASDGLVTYTQAQALCEGFGGAVNVNWTLPSSLYRQTFTCGPSSYLHLIKEATHAFEICLPGLVCLSGSQGSANAAADSLRKGREWLLNGTPPQ